VELSRDDGRVKLTVSDDGRGFSFEAAGRGLGIAGMRERALLVGGDLKIESRPEQGTRIRLLVPAFQAEGRKADN
jgi:signal transduction histidine kinase